ncbi:response regulator [Sediminibacterium soli]|uniref:response regulator n=1 Tax=Sediminibacterium soli TaxID=2698829 RepID=UPI00137AD5EC|nr:response regulator [Sediminibacterium soli]NCI46746.1 response regulator transcription factor [Sediminibacterium soli]
MMKMILVEDDYAIRDAFSAIFTPPGYELTALDTGEPIWNTGIASPDIFVLDKNIAGTDGGELCRFIKQAPKYRNIPVLLLSASPDLAETEAGSCADGYLEKPFTISAIKAIVDRHAVSFPR